MPTNITLQGADYPDVPSVILPQTGGGTAEFWRDMKPYLIRPDAERVKIGTYDKLIHEDEGVTIPTYSTSAKTLKATENTMATTLDYSTYNYYVIERTLTIPYYTTTAIAKGRAEYHIGSHLWEIVDIPANSYITLVDGKKYASRSVGGSVQSYARLLYWSSASAISPYSTSAYGVFQAFNAPVISSSTLTLRTPTLGMRGHTAYLSETFYNAITDIRFQYILELWRCRKNNLNVSGWGLEQQARHVLDCVNSATHVLT